MELREFENRSEKSTRRILEFETKETIYYVNAKTRLEDVFRLGEGDSRDEQDFLRNAHFDYTLHRESSNKVIWAFEFDGPTHSSSPVTIRRDILKNRICAKANLPLLRVEDDLLEAIDGVSLLGWLVRRWMIYKRIMPRMESDRKRVASEMSEQAWDELRISEGLFILPPELDTETLFDLGNPYPPLPKISVRLLQQYGIKEGLSLELNPNWGQFDENSPWTLMTSGPEVDLSDYGFRHRSYCEVALRRTEDTRYAKPVFAATGEYMARLGYPTFRSQRGPFDPNPETEKFELCGPPYGGSLWAAGPMISWYRALKQVEAWAAKNLPRRRGTR